jgi:hypothetical protein
MHSASCLESLDIFVFRRAFSTLPRAAHYHVQHITTSPYYPQPPHAERFNRNLRAALIAYLSEVHASWDHLLTWLQFEFNTAEHESTKTSSFRVMFPIRAGSPLTNQWKIQELLPDNVDKRVLERRWAQVRQNLCRSGARVEHRYNLRRYPNPYKLGDIFYYKNHPISHAGRREAAKLMPRYKGPYEIVRFLTPVSVSLSDPESSKIVTRAHISTLKPGTVCKN